MRSIATVVVGMEAPEQFRVAAAQALPICARLEAQCSKCPFLRWRIPASLRSHVALTGANMGSRSGPDRLQRIGKVTPARNPVDARIRPEGSRGCRPTMQRRLRFEDLFRAHSIEIVIAGIELAYVVEAEPTIIARSVEAGGARPWRAKLARLPARGPSAFAVRRFEPSMKSMLAHRLPDGRQVA